MDEKSNPGSRVLGRSGGELREGQEADNLTTAYGRKHGKLRSEERVNSSDPEASSRQAGEERGGQGSRMKWGLSTLGENL